MLKKGNGANTHVLWGATHRRRQYFKNIFTTSLNKSCLINWKNMQSVAYSSTKILQHTSPFETFRGKKPWVIFCKLILREKKFNLELRIYREGLFDITVQFAKRKDALINGFQYYNSTTKIPKLLNFTTTIIILKILALDGPTRSSTWVQHNAIER